MSERTGATTEDPLRPSLGFLVAVAGLLSFASVLIAFLHLIPFDDGTWVAEHGSRGKFLAKASVALHLALPATVVAALARRRGGSALRWAVAAVALALVAYVLIVAALLFSMPTEP